MSKITITGNSHTIALNQGRNQSPELTSVEVFGLGPGVHETTAFSALKTDRVVLTQPVYAENLKRFTGLDHIDPDRFWGLCIGTHNSRIYGDRAWVKAAAPSAVASPAQRPVSIGQLQQIIAQDQQHINAFITQLKTVGIRFIVISGPPVRADHQNIIRRAAPETLLEVDRQARKHFQGMLLDLDVDFIDYPAETTDKMGLLRPEFAAGPLQNGKRDPHHGNAAYGRIMLDKVLSELP